MALVPIKTASTTGYCDCIHGCYELASLRDEDTGKEVDQKRGSRRRHQRRQCTKERAADGAGEREAPAGVDDPALSKPACQPAGYQWREDPQDDVDRTIDDGKALGRPMVDAQEKGRDPVAESVRDHDRKGESQMMTDQRRPVFGEKATHLRARRRTLPMIG